MAYNLGGFLIDQKRLLTYWPQKEHMQCTLEPGRTDASRILQVVKPDVDIISRKKSEQQEKD